MDKLVLGVILLGAALPVAVGFIYGLGLLLALVFVQILAQVQDPSAVVLDKGRDRCVNPSRVYKNTTTRKHRVVNMLERPSGLLHICLILSNPEELLLDLSV